MKEVRFGIVGVGIMGNAHANSLKDVSGACLAAVCDVPEKADEIAKKYGVKAFYSASEMYASKKIDAVIISTPHYTHLPMSKQAFEAGLHVITEKPIAVHKADALKMAREHAKYPQLKFGVMFQQRTDAYYMKIKNMIDTGELGKIYRINWTVTNWFRSQRYYDSGGWRATWKGEGGGVLMNQCPHNLDLFQWFFGMPVKVRAFCSLGKYHNIEVEDDVTAYCEYADGGTGVFITSTGEAPGTNRLEIACERGKLIAENGKITFTRTEVSVDKFRRTTETSFNLPAVWDVDVPYPNESGQHKKIIQAFVNSILKGSPLVVEAEEGMKSVELANAMLMSSLEKKTVSLPLDPKKFEGILKGLIKKSKFIKSEVKESKVDFSSSFQKK